MARHQIPGAPVPLVILFLVVLGVAAAAGCTTLPGTTTSPLAGSNFTGPLAVYYLDVGQGDSELIRFHNTTILIDAGEAEMGDRVVSNLHRLGVTRIDLLVATHAHSDHIGGMPAVLSAFPVGRVIDPGVPSTSPVYESFLKQVEKRKIPYSVAVQGETIDLDPALRILVLSPPEKRLNDDPNQNSVVLRVSYGTTSFLFTGDMGGETESALAKSGYALDARVLKVGHHGSSGSSSAVFLSRVNPDIAVISLGKANDYGHPHKETLDRLAAAGSTIFRTDTDGTVRVISDGSRIGVTSEKGDAGLWNAAVYAQTPTAPVSPPLPSVTLNTSALESLVPENITIPVTLPAVQLGNASSVYISSVQFDAPGDDRNNLNGEWARVANRGEGPVLITGWTLSDRTGSFTYTFPAVVLLPEESVTVYTGSGAMNDTSLFMGKSSPVWGNAGDTAILRDGSGTIIDQRSGA